MGWFSQQQPPQYEPSARDVWKMQQDAIKQRQGEIRADQREAQKLQQQMVDAERRAIQDRRKLIAAAEAAADAEAAAEEKALLTEPVTRYVGATRKNTKSIIVWHHQVEPPAELAVATRRGGLGALLALRPGGGAWRASDAVYSALKAKYPNVKVDFPAFAAAVEKALREVPSAYPILTTLRDDRRMAQVFAAAGVTMESRETETLTGEYGAYKRTVTVVNVPSLIDVVIGKSGLELIYRARLGDSAKNWGGKLETLKNAFRQLGIAADSMTIGESESGDIVLKLNDRDPLSDPLPQVIHKFDADRGRSLVGKGADGSDLYIALRDNACVLVAGMPGGGKTASLMPVLAGMRDEVELHIVDGAASGEWAVLQPICASYDDSGDIEILGDLMENVLAACRERMKIVTGAGEVNFWNIPRGRRESLGLRPMVVVVEEAPNFLASGQPGKDAVAAAQRNMVLTGKAVKLVRKAGISIMLIAQKPTDKEIPSIIRDLAAVRLCFRLDSDIAAQTVLGDSAYIEPKPTSIPPGRPGRFVGRLDARGNILGQAVYVPVDQIAAHVKGATPVVGTPCAESTPETAPVTETETETAAMDEPAAMDEGALLAALAEAQRRGLIPAPATKPITAAEPAAATISTTSKGFDF